MPAQQLRPYMNSGEPPGLTPQRIPAVNPPLESQTQSPSPSLGLPSKNRSVSDLVRDSKLIAFQTDDTSIVRHIVYTSNPHMRQRRMKTEEAWKRREKLGTGAFGQVYLEELLSGSEAGKLRAVKEIAKTPPQDPRKEIDYTRELEAIAKFSHPKYVHCFVKSYGWYESDLTIFITMEYASKGNLQGYLTKQFPEGEAQQITYQIAEGISYMHENSFAHRDLKPANILVFESSPDWWVKISDFGISKRAEEEVTAFHTLVGTRGYLAPEILGFFSPRIPMRISMAKGTTCTLFLWTCGLLVPSRSGS
uniref:mitogen-activated protein kinase n=1 Tax=Bionectria ochroleuca TaxID=29856 RepID=A0A8H7N300_BIOOC